jgi:hypothetical protein
MDERFFQINLSFYIRFKSSKGQLFYKMRIAFSNKLMEGYGDFLRTSKKASKLYWFLVKEGPYFCTHYK